MSVITNVFRHFSPQLSHHNPLSYRLIHICSSLGTYYKDAEESRSLYPEPKRWPEKNLRIYPPQDMTETPQERWYCHHRSNIKYSPKKMWYIAAFIRGMSVDEAIKQLSFVPKKGAQIVKEVLEEGCEIAVREHNFEYRSNMWIAESFATKGLVIKGIRKHARQRYGEVRYFHCHYYVRFVEGPPPPYYYEAPKSGNDKFKNYIEELRKRRIMYGL